MKRIFLCLLAIIALAAADLSARTFVLAVGVSRQGLEGANDLSQTTKDAAAFRQVMQSHSKGITMLTPSISISAATAAKEPSAPMTT